ncbi:hypothetical protein JOM56_003019 [Amanita muscaria]
MWYALNLYLIHSLLILACSNLPNLMITNGSLSAAGAGLSGRARKGGDFSQIQLPENKATKLMAEHVPALHFSNLSYTLDAHTILDNVSGIDKSGQIMTIMGASGAGKSTLLDLLAKTNERNSVCGTIHVNGCQITPRAFSYTPTSTKPGTLVERSTMRRTHFRSCYRVGFQLTTQPVVDGSTSSAFSYEPSP